MNDTDFSSFTDFTPLRNDKRHVATRVMTSPDNSKVIAQDEGEWTIIESHEVEEFAGSPGPSPPQQQQSRLEEDEEGAADRILEAVAARNLFDKGSLKGGLFEGGVEETAHFDRVLTVPKIFMDLMTFSSLERKKQMEEDDLDEEDFAQVLISFFLELGGLAMPALSWIERRTREPIFLDLKGPKLALARMKMTLRHMSATFFGHMKRTSINALAALQKATVDQEGKPTWGLVYMLSGATFVSAAVAVWTSISGTDY